MMKQSFFAIAIMALFGFWSCDLPAPPKEAEKRTEHTSRQNTDLSNFKWVTETFSDKKIIRYQIPGFDKLSLQQKKLVYYLAQAGYSGRDIIWDQNYRHNLEIRDGLETVYTNFKGDKKSSDWLAFDNYVKNVWFSNGIHHHYGYEKFIPDFSKDFFLNQLKKAGGSMSEAAVSAMFDPKVDSKKLEQSPGKDVVLASAVNFYGPDVTQDEVDAFYRKKTKNAGAEPISYGLNSQLIKNSYGSLEEKVWKIDGMYGPAIAKIVYWLEKAVTVAENDAQKEALELLVDYYKTGDLATWDKYNIKWVQATEGDVDYINSFIEVYNDPKGYRGSYESIIEITDFDASERMAAVAKEAQWFEDNSPIMDAHKKKNVVGITYKVVNVAAESGDASPSTPIGVNLPNANWIRAKHGSKSVSLGNIVEAYAQSSGGSIIGEFAFDEAEIKRDKKYGALADKLHTALHEVIGHASGQLEPGVGTPKETVKSYASPLEEARADLVALYYLMDEQLVTLGLMPSIEVGKTAYDGYILNGMMTQLRRIKPGDKIEQAHMRNRQMISLWAYEKGKKDNIIEKVTRNGNTYLKIRDYDKLRALFGDLLREVQRIKSQGDYKSAMHLFETYGHHVDEKIHEEVLARSEKLNIPPYGGFINPKLVPVMSDGVIQDIKVTYPNDFATQMLEYGEEYSFLR